MKHGLIPRNVMSVAKEIMVDTPITVISGARQVGKSTLMHQVLDDRNARILNLDDISVLEAAKADPVGFVAQYREGTLAIDEVQREPQLFVALKNE